MDYRPNLIKIKPNYVVHGDDWKTGIQKTRFSNFCFKKMERKINRTKIYKKYFFYIIKGKILDIGTTPDVRKEKLSRLIQAKKL